jgi:hypothetical protein
MERQQPTHLVDTHCWSYSYGHDGGGGGGGGGDDGVREDPPRAVPGLGGGGAASGFLRPRGLNGGTGDSWR